MIKQIVPIFLSILLIFILLFGFSRLFGPLPFSLSSTTTNKTDSFSVSGEGKVAAKPDVAMISVGVQTEAVTVKLAQEQLNAAINQVSENIKKLGVEEKDIQTASYNINPSYDYKTSSPKITGFQASTNLNIKVRDIDKANSVIDAASANGANQIGGITFEVADKTKAENEARQKAVDEAKSKAEKAASVAGFKLGKIINYSENFNGAVQPVPMLERNMGQGAADTKTNIEPGSSEVRVIVTLSYELR